MYLILKLSRNTQTWVSSEHACHPPPFSEALQLWPCESASWQLQISPQAPSLQRLWNTREAQLRVVEVVSSEPQLSFLGRTGIPRSGDSPDGCWSYLFTQCLAVQVSALRAGRRPGAAPAPAAAKQRAQVLRHSCTARTLPAAIPAAPGSHPCIHPCSLSPQLPPRHCLHGHPRALPAAVTACVPTAAPSSHPHGFPAAIPMPVPTPFPQPLPAAPAVSPSVPTSSPQLSPLPPSPRGPCGPALLLPMAAPARGWGQHSRGQQRRGRQRCAVLLHLPLCSHSSLWRWQAALVRAGLGDT